MSVRIVVVSLTLCHKRERLDAPQVSSALTEAQLGCCCPWRLRGGDIQVQEKEHQLQGTGQAHAARESNSRTHRSRSGFAGHSSPSDDLPFSRLNLGLEHLQLNLALVFHSTGQRTQNIVQSRQKRMTAPIVGCCSSSKLLGFGACPAITGYGYLTLHVAFFASKIVVRLDELKIQKKTRAVGAKSLTSTLSPCLSQSDTNFVTNFTQARPPESFSTFWRK